VKRLLVITLSALFLSSGYSQVEPSICMEEYMYLSYKSRELDENKDWYWIESVSEIIEFCDSIEPCISGLNFKLLNGITTVNNRYENDVLAFEGLTKGFDLLEGNTFKVVLDFNIDGKFEGFEYLQFDSEITRKEEMENIKKRKQQLKKIELQEQFEIDWKNSDVQCREEFRAFLENNSWILSKNTSVRKTNLPLEDFQDSVEIYSSCLTGITIEEFDFIFKGAFNLEEEPKIRKGKRILANDSLFPFPDPLNGRQGWVRTSTDSTGLLVWKAELALNGFLIESHIEICGGSRESRARGTRNFMLSEFLQAIFPYYSELDCSFVLAEKDIINNELDKLNQMFINHEFPISFLEKKRFKIEKDDVGYQITAFYARKGIDKIDFSKVHKLIIRVNEDDLIQSIEYVCP